MIGRIKSKLSIEACLEHFGVEAPPEQRNIVMVPCPWHDDQTPSLAIYRREGRAWCFSCNKGGDVIDVTAIFIKSDISGAIAYWRERLGFAPEIRRNPPGGVGGTDIRDYVTRRSREMEDLGHPKIPELEPHLVYIFSEKEEIDAAFRQISSLAEFAEYLAELYTWRTWAERLLRLFAGLRSTKLIAESEVTNEDPSSR